MFNLLPVKVISGTSAENLLSDNTMYIIENGKPLRLKNGFYNGYLKDVYYNLNINNQGDLVIMKLYSGEIITLGDINKKDNDDNVKIYVPRKKQ